MRTPLAIAAAGAVLIAGLACGYPASGDTPQPPSQVDVEDCDAEDFRNREDDCGFTDADRRKTIKPSPRKTAGTPTKTTKGRR